MDAFQPTLDDLIFELRSNSDSDKGFAQRVALACAHIADLAKAGREPVEPGEAIRSIFCVSEPGSQEAKIVRRVSRAR